MKKQSTLIMIIAFLALALGIFGGKVYFNSIKNNKTEEKPNDNKKDDIKEDNDKQNDVPSITNKIDVIKKLFGQELIKQTGIEDYIITSYEEVDSAGNLQIYKILYDFTYSDKYIGADRVAGTNTVKNKSNYVTVMQEDGKYNIVDSATGGKVSAKDELGKLAFIKYLKSIDNINVKNYRIKQCEYEKTIENELVFHIIFDVQSDPIMDAGNGDIKSDNWVENKNIWVYMIEYNGEYLVNKSKGMTTGI